MGKNHILIKEENSSSNRWKVINLDFQNKTELIQFLADHLAYQYKKSFEKLQKTNSKEYNRRIAEIPEFKKALKFLLKIRLMLFKELIITNESLILKIAFKKARIKNLPEDSFKASVEYKIKGLNIERIEYKIS